MSSKILQVKKSLRRLEDITSLQDHTYTPYCTAFNNNDEIRITIQSQDLYVLPSDSYLLIEFHVGLRDGQPLGAEASCFSNLFIAHMFSEMRYELNGFEIDRCKTPGITSALKMLIACQEKDKENLLLVHQRGMTTIAAGTYQMVLPLRFVFGFCEDYEKIVLNSKHELILVRHRTNANMFVQAAAEIDELNLDFSVTKLVWKMPHVSLSDGAKLSMLRMVSQNNELHLPFRSWDLYELPVVPQTTRHTWSVKTTNKVNKPRYVIVAFQTNRQNVVRADPSKFDHCNTTNMKLYLNNERYPYDDYHLDFAHHNYHELFLTLSKIQHSYYNGNGGSNPMNGWPDYNTFATLPVFAFDCSRSDENLKPGMVDVRIEIETSANIPANTTAYCMIIHDNLIKYSPFSSTVYRDV